MPKICYISRTFGAASMRVIERANTIIAEYLTQGYDLTLRQLYYQFVSRDLIANSDREYKRLGAIVNDARLAGLIDWQAIIDRTRSLRAIGHWDTAAQIIQSAAYSFATDKWGNQPYRVEVWIEKDALAGVFAGVCNELDVPYFSCRGYTSQSEMWAAGERLKRHCAAGQTPIILHFGDHDPSGQDMTRDIADRLELFMGGVEVRRLALNMDQVEQYTPPPNPAKITDARAAAYISHYGDESWELDALEPAVLTGLVRDAVEELRDGRMWDAAVAAEEGARRQLKAAAKLWPTIAASLPA